MGTGRTNAGSGSGLKVAFGSFTVGDTVPTEKIIETGIPADIKYAYVYTAAEMSALGSGKFRKVANTWETAAGETSTYGLFTGTGVVQEYEQFGTTQYREVHGNIGGYPSISRTDGNRSIKIKTGTSSGTFCANTTYTWMAMY